MTDQERIKGFQREFKELLVKYQPEVKVDRGYYGDVEGVDFYFGPKIAVTYVYDTDYTWDFGNGWEQINKEEE